MTAPWLLEMAWRDVCFAHWRVDPAALAAYLPRNVRVDTYGGSAWLSVVPFRMTGIHARGMPTLYGFNDVPEINLRTYVTAGGLPAVWFFSLDASSPLAVRSARLMTGLPYFDAAIRIDEHDGAIAYASERRSRGKGGTFAAVYEPRGEARAAQPGTIEAFLHERYAFVAQARGRLVRGTIAHRPWQLSGAEIAIARNTLGSIIDVSLDERPDAVYFAHDLAVRATGVRRLRR